MQTICAESPLQITVQARIIYSQQTKMDIFHSVVLSDKPTGLLYIPSHACMYCEGKKPSETKQVLVRRQHSRYMDTPRSTQQCPESRTGLSLTPPCGVPVSPVLGTEAYIVWHNSVYEGCGNMQTQPPDILQGSKIHCPRQQLMRKGNCRTSYPACIVCMAISIYRGAVQLKCTGFTVTNIHIYTTESLA